MNPGSEYILLEAAYHLGLLEKKEWENLQSQSLSAGEILQKYCHQGRLLEHQLKNLKKLCHRGYLYCESCHLVYPQHQTEASSFPPCSQCQSSLEPFPQIESPSRLPTGGQVSPTQSQPNLPTASSRDPEILHPKAPPGYRVLKLLGKGGYGRVYQVQDPLGQRTMALKVIPSHRIRNPRTKKRFLREIRITSQLEHPHIMPVYESGFLQGGSLYFVMKELRGGTLKDLLRSQGKGKSPVDEIRRHLEILLKVCDAVDYAHSQGVIHRDLKPANIAVDDYGEVILLDWGIARYIDEDEDRDLFESSLKPPPGTDQDLTLQGSILGTPGYFPPEQARGEVLDKRADIYSLGAILYEILTLSAPYSGNAQERLVNTILKEIPLPEERHPKGEIPSELSAIALKALARSKEDRYQTVGEFKGDLLRFLSGYAVEAKSYTSLEKAWVWMRRHKKKIALCLFTFLLVATSAVTVKWWEKKKVQREKALRKAEKERKFLRLFEKAQKEFKEIPTLAELGVKFNSLPSLLQPLAPREERQIESSLASLLKIRNLLEKASHLNFQKEEIQKELAKVEARLGELALRGRKYFLCHLAYQRCIQLGERERGEEGLMKLEKVREFQKTREVARIEEIMEELKKGPPRRGMRDEYVTEMVRMKGGRHVVNKLLYYLRSDWEWPRIVAIETLGKLGDRKSTFEGKDVGEWLIARLRELPWKTNQAEGEALIWALGRLRETRAIDLIQKIRNEAGEEGVFWRRTQIPFSWIPLPEKSSAGKRDWFKRGRTLYLQGRYKPAIEAFARFLKENPHHSRAWNNRGMARYFCRDYQKALENFSRAIKEDPDYVEAWLNRGMTFVKIGKFDLALRDLNQAVKLDPQNTPARNNRSIALARKGRYEEALADLKKSLEIDGNQSSAYQNRGMIFTFQKKYDRAVEAINQGIRLNPKKAELYLLRGNAYYRWGKRDLALADYTRCLSLDPQNIRAYNNRGSLRRLLKDYEGAVADYTRVLEVDPRHYKTLLNRAMVFAKMKNFSRALQDVEKAIEMASDFPPAYHLKAIVLMKKGEKKKAAQEFARFLKMNPQTSKKEEIRKFIEKHGQ